LTSGVSWIKRTGQWGLGEAHKDASLFGRTSDEVQLIVACEATTSSSASRTTGAGIADADLPSSSTRSFGPTAVATARPAAPVSALAIMQRLIDAHGGTVTAENRAQGGARFVVRLTPGVSWSAPPPRFPSTK
jgi:K+-sensing histidine kinase KdpD